MIFADRDKDMHTTKAPSASVSHFASPTAYRVHSFELINTPARKSFRLLSHRAACRVVTLRHQYQKWYNTGTRHTLIILCEPILKLDESLFHRRRTRFTRKAICRDWCIIFRYHRARTPALLIELAISSVCCCAIFQRDIDIIPRDYIMAHYGNLPPGAPHTTCESRALPSRRHYHCLEDADAAYFGHYAADIDDNIWADYYYYSRSIISPPTGS